MNPAWIVRTMHRQVAAHPHMVLATCAAFCFLALVAGGARLGTRTVARWGAFASQNIHLIAYFAEDVDEAAALGLRDILRRAPGVAQVTLVEPAQALARLRASAQSFAADSKVLDGLEPAYFPHSLEISLTPAADLSARARDLASRLRAVPGVAEVDGMTSGLARLAVWVKLGRTVGLAVLIALGFVALLALVAVFLRGHAAMARRAAVLDQLGETPAAIRLPAGLWTAMAALTGGGVGALLLALAWRPLLDRLERSLGVVATLPSAPLAPAEVAAGLAIMALAGLAMGYFATPVPRPADHA
jgi:cell division transport system permease protein